MDKVDNTETGKRKVNRNPKSDRLSNEDTEFGGEWENADTELFTGPGMNAFSGESASLGHDDDYTEPDTEMLSRETGEGSEAQFPHHSSRYTQTLEDEHRAYEEYASELAAPAGLKRNDDPSLDRDADAPSGITRNMDTQAGTGQTVGWIGMILALASLFIWPAVLGLAAAIVGFVAYLRGNRALGIGAVVIGLIAFIAYVAIVPYYS